jgi:hypothetical protein
MGVTKAWLPLLKTRQRHYVIRSNKMFLYSYSAWSRLRLKCDGTCAETRFHLSAKRTSPFKSAPGGGGRQFSRLLAAEVCGISGGNVGYTMFRGSVKGTGYPLYSAASPSLPLPCVTVCHHISTVFPTNAKAITARAVKCSLQQQLGNCSQPRKETRFGPSNISVSPDVKQYIHER